MTTQERFESLLSKVDPSIKREVNLNLSIATRIDEVLSSKKITQRELARKLGISESQVSRWISGRHGFTTSTIAKIEAALDCSLIDVRQEQKVKDLVPQNITFYIPVIAKGININLSNLNNRTPYEYQTFQRNN